MAGTQSSRKRQLLEGPADRQRQQGTQHQPAGLPSSNSTARHYPQLSEQCYKLVVLAQLPQAEHGSDFTAAAYSVLEATLSSVQAATGLQTLQQQGTGDVAVSLTGETCTVCQPGLVIKWMRMPAKHLSPHFGHRTYSV